MLLGLVAFGMLFEGIFTATGLLGTAIEHAWGSTASTVIVLMLGYVPMGVVFLVATILIKWVLVGCVRPGSTSCIHP